MTNEPLGRQPKSVVVTVCGTAPIDVYNWASRLRHFCGNGGDSIAGGNEVTPTLDGTAYRTSFTVHPRAIND